jgi:SAM-dependent methyltransferase
MDADHDPASPSSGAWRGPAPGAAQPATSAPAYAERLATLSGKKWKRLLDVQRPYRWNLRRQVEGLVLEVGCGLGRNLDHLSGRAVGVDHNADAVQTCIRRGHDAYRPEDFHRRMAEAPVLYDTLLLAHVLEHMTRQEAVALLQDYLPYLRPAGLLLLICPQEAGFASDETHVEFLDAHHMNAVAAQSGCQPGPSSSFPFPRRVGRVFRYNETIVRARKAAESA